MTTNDILDAIRARIAETEADLARLRAAETALIVEQVQPSPVTVTGNSRTEMTAAPQVAAQTFPSDPAKTRPGLRPGSHLDRAVQLLEAEGAPLHVDVIASRIGVPRASLVGTLERGRRGKVLARPKPGTYGLADPANAEQLG